MIYPVYAFRDIKANFSQPYCEQNDAAALRGFAYMVSGQDGLMSFSASDYDLFRIGSYDSETGVLFPEESIVFLANGSSVVGGKNEK